MAAYEVFEADCVTLSPFMGWDSIHPFVTNKYSNKGAFVLCKTSNKSSKVNIILQGNYNSLCSFEHRMSRK